MARAAVGGGALDELAALRLQVEWGADEALLTEPLDRFAPAAAAPVRPAARVPEASAAPAGRQTVVPLAAGPGLAVERAAAAASLEALYAAADTFEANPLRATASTTVAPSGNPQSGLLLVGEAPGADDDRAGRAFSGPAGDRLDHVLRSAGLGRDDLLLALLVPWRAPGGRPISEAERAAALPFFYRLLALVRPRRLVLMGAAPYAALGGEPGGFRKARGQWRDVALPGLETPVPALTTLPPDLWLSTAANKQAIWADLLNLRAALDSAAE